MGNQLETNGNAAAGGKPAPCGRLLAFEVDGLRYALPLGAVLAVAEGGAGADVVAHRGREVPVEEAAGVGLGRPGAGRDRGAGTVLVVDTPGGMRAVRVDAVTGFVGEAEVRRWPALLAALAGPGFPGVVLGGGGTLVLVDAAALAWGRGPGESGAPGGARGTP